MKRAALVRRVGRLLVSVGALAMAGAASASWVTPMGATTVEYVSGGVRITDGTGGWQMQSRSWANPVSRNVGVSEQLRGTLGGKDLLATATRSLSPAAVIGAAARCFANPICMAVTAGSAAAIADFMGSRRVASDGAGGLLVDEGTDEVPVTAWVCNSSSFGGTPCTQSGNTSGEAAAAHVAAIPKPSGACEPYGPTVTGSNSVGAIYTQSSVEVGYFVMSHICGSTWQSGSVVVRSSTVEQCPASVDPTNPAYSIPAGSPVGFDGKCPTARYNHVPIAADAVPAWADSVPASDAALRGMAERAVAGGESIEATGERQMSGPASVSGGSPSVTTETKPDGTVITTTKTPTITYTYNGDTITYTTTYVTTVHNSTTNETTTINEGTPGDQTDPESECVKNPDALGCVKLGTAPDEAPEWQTVDVPFAAEDLGFAGACPAPVSWSVFGLTLSWSYQPVCDVAPMIRVALLLMASIGAIGIVFKETSA